MVGAVGGVVGVVGGGGWSGGRVVGWSRHREVRAQKPIARVAAVDATVEQPVFEKPRFNRIDRVGLASEKAPAAERAASFTSTTKIPSPTVNAPEPPALRIKVFVAPPAPTDVPSTTNVSERVAAPPSLSTVSSFSVPPLETKVPGPPRREPPASRARR